MRLVATLALLLCSCHDSAGGPDLAAADLAMPAPPLDLSAVADLSFSSSCGQPGDTGNSLGVGKFCMVQADCNQGTFCTHPYSPDDYFCTIPCSTGTAGQCGEAASCQCNSNSQCGCILDACLALPQD